jgi:hypothetical protein
MTSPSDTRPRVWLDHFVVAINDLDAGTSMFETLTGVHPVHGGAHPSLGTHNALVSLGSGLYLEILAPRPGALLDPLVQGVRQCDTLRPILWAVATDDISLLHAVVTAAGFAANDPSPGKRVTMEGEILRWSMFTMREDTPANAPFFIEWDKDTRHPSSSAPTGCSLDSFTLASPDHANVQRLLAAVGLKAIVTPGPSRTLISLQTPRGAITLGT